MQGKTHADEPARLLTHRGTDCNGDQQHSVTQHVAFLPELQRAVLLQSEAQEREEEIWQRLFAIGKQLQRAGYCAGNCQGQSLTIGREEAV